MFDLPSPAFDAMWIILTVVAIYHANVARNLFAGDVMERVFRLLLFWLVLILALAILDFTLDVEGAGTLYLFQLALVVTAGMVGLSNFEIVR
jgi:hypothetical protein